MDDRCPTPPTLAVLWLVAGPLDYDDRWALPSSVPIQPAVIDDRRAELSATTAGERDQLSELPGSAGSNVGAS